MALIQSALAATDESRQAVLKLIGRNPPARPATGNRGRDPRTVESRRRRAQPSPLLWRPVIHDAEVLAIVLHAWPRLTQPERLQAIEALLGRPGPRRCRRTPRAGHGSPAPRGQRPFGCRARPNVTRDQQPAARSGAARARPSCCLSALADDEPALRRRGLTLASTKPGFWSRPDTQEYLKRLLVDPDPQVRLLALSTVEQHGLIRNEPSLARRVKALAADPGPESAGPQVAYRRTTSIPRRSQPTCRLSRPRLLSFSTFRRKVNPALLSGRRRQARLSRIATPTTRSSASPRPTPAVASVANSS